MNLEVSLDTKNAIIQQYKSDKMAYCEKMHGKIGKENSELLWIHEQFFEFLGTSSAFIQLPDELILAYDATSRTYNQNTGRSLPSIDTVLLQNMTKGVAQEFVKQQETLGNRVKDTMLKNKYLSCLLIEAALFDNADALLFVYGTTVAYIFYASLTEELSNREKAQRMVRESFQDTATKAKYEAMKEVFKNANLFINQEKD